MSDILKRALAKLAIVSDLSTTHDAAWADVMAEKHLAKATVGDNGTVNASEAIKAARAEPNAAKFAHVQIDPVDRFRDAVNDGSIYEMIRREAKAGEEGEKKRPSMADLASVGRPVRRDAR
jgi:hypothetical protein